MNKPVYLGRSILEFSKMLMCGFWYYYGTPKYGEKENCVIYIDSFIVYMKTDDMLKC